MSLLGALGTPHCGLEKLGGPRHESYARKHGLVCETEVRTTGGGGQRMRAETQVRA